MLTVNPSSPAIIYMMTATNKRLLISESRVDSNRCTSCRGKPDQYNAYAFHASPHTPGVRFLQAVPVRGNISRSLQQRWVEPLLPRKGLPTQSPARQLTDLWVRTQFLSRASHWSSGGKATLCRQPATRLTRPISPTCDRYVQYLLTGANRTVLNWHRRGLQPWRCRLATYHSPTFPTSCLHFPLVAPLDLQFNPVPTIDPKCWVLK
jgi:hypothetical protein